MTRTLRGAWSRRGTLLPLLLLTVVVVAGAVTVIGVRRTAPAPRRCSPCRCCCSAPSRCPPPDGSWPSPGAARSRWPGCAASQGGELYRAARGRAAPGPAARRAAPGLVLGRRGRCGGRPAPGSARAGRAAGRGRASSPAPRSSCVVGLVAVLLGMAGALREPLVGPGQHRRPAARRLGRGRLRRRAGRWSAAVVAVYRSSVAGGDPDWVVLAGPALVGLAVGQLVVWLIRVVARLAVARTAPARSLTGFLAVRRLARVADAATPMRVLVAAAVVAALALTGAAAGRRLDRRHRPAPHRRAAPGARWTSDAVGALQLTRDLDPDGPLADGRGAGARARAASSPGGRSSTPRGSTRWSATSTPAPPPPASSPLVAGLGGGDGSVATGDRSRRPCAGVSARRAGTDAPAGPGRLPRLQRQRAAASGSTCGSTAAAAAAARPAPRCEGCDGGCAGHRGHARPQPRTTPRCPGC